MTGLLARPRLIGALCATGAVGLGLLYLTLAGAPSRALLVNLAALLLGLGAWGALGRARSTGPWASGVAVALLAAALLATALFGMSVEGASRWVNVAGLSVQVSLVTVPVLVTLFARRANAIGAAGVVAAAFALAAQPDRAMAGVLAGCMATLALAQPRRLLVAPILASMAAFVWTMLRPDDLPAVPYVDGVLYSAFSAHALAGGAVVAGSALLLVPALSGAARLSAERHVVLVFGAAWAGIILAAALGNYPTPLVGYGGSAILGYLLSAGLLPGGVASTTVTSAAASAGSAHRPAVDGLEMAQPARG